MAKLPSEIKVGFDDLDGRRKARSVMAWMWIAAAGISFLLGFPSETILAYVICSQIWAAR